MTPVEITRIISQKLWVVYMIIKRYLADQVKQDLLKKMVFVGGPRQVGKTTMAKSLLEKDSLYLNWDIPQHRESIMKHEIPTENMVVFDELHKYKQWRQYLKGIFDLYGNQKKILVTGSARLDFYRHGGDSLQGRYHFLRLLPLTVAELGINTKSDLNNLLTLSGFPEPFFSGSETEAKRWSREYRSRLIQDDLVNLEKVTDVQKIEFLMMRLPDLVGSPLSINSLREDLHASHKAVSNWISILEKLYAIFRIPPFEDNILRAITKMQKHYHYDWSLVKEKGLRFENMIAVHLLKWCCYQQDVLGEDTELRYFKDIDGREVDFVVVENKKPIFCVECKQKDESPSNHMRYFLTRFPSCEGWHVTLEGNKNIVSRDRIRITSAEVFLQNFV